MAADSTPGRSSRRLLTLLPFLLFAGMAGLFLVQLMSGRNNADLPSALIGQQAPETKLPALEGMQVPGLDSAQFKGKVTLVNVWASWCPPCREEHPLLMALAQDKRFGIAGINYKDSPQNALRFLGGLGNPYSAIGVDQAGRTAIDWGVYGVPETFLVGKDGRILLKHVGPLNQQAIAEKLMPEVEKALAAQ